MGLISGLLLGMELVVSTLITRTTCTIMTCINIYIYTDQYMYGSVYVRISTYIVIHIAQYISTDPYTANAYTSGAQKLQQGQSQH